MPSWPLHECLSHLVLVCASMYQASVGPYSLMEGTGAMVPLTNRSTSRGVVVTSSREEVSLGIKGCMLCVASRLFASRGCKGENSCMSATAGMYIVCSTQAACLLHDVALSRPPPEDFVQGCRKPRCLFHWAWPGAQAKSAAPKGHSLSVASMDISLVSHSDLVV